MYCIELVMRHTICNPFSTHSVPTLYPLSLPILSTHYLYPILYPLYPFSTHSLPILYTFSTHTLPTLSTHSLCPSLYTLSTHSLPTHYPFSTHHSLPTIYPLSTHFLPTLYPFSPYTHSLSASFGRSRRRNAMRLRLRRLRQ
jgi:hypothetical protein